MMQKLVIATHNQGKLRELRSLLEPLGISVASASEYDVPEPEETGTSFAENAALKAVHSARLTGLPALADDSGLCVDALDGAPGIYSARWAGADKDFDKAMERIRCELTEAGHDAEGASAHFVCELCLAWPDGAVEHFTGTVEGELTFPPRGDKGFGYDPVFVPNEHELTFAEMDPKSKEGMSHRAHAFHQFVAYVKTANVA